MVFSEIERQEPYQDVLMSYQSHCYLSSSMQDCKDQNNNDFYYFISSILNSTKFNVNSLPLLANPGKLIQKNFQNFSFPGHEPDRIAGKL